MIESYEKLDKKDTFKRISVLLDKKTFDALNKLMNKKHLKISGVVRLSIIHYFQHEIGEKSNLDELEKIAQYLNDGSHLIIDIETIITIINAVNDPKKFWENVEMDGYRHGIYYKSIGLDDLDEILKQMVTKNWFKLRVESDNCYLLILPTPELQKFLKYFIKGLANALNVKIKIKEIGGRNLILCIK